MSSLAQQQRDFQEHVLRRSPAIEAQIIGTTRVPALTRLGIYSGAYGSRLAESLGKSFPVVVKLLGDEEFEKLAAAYVRAHDSPFFSIRYYGDRLAEFLSAEPIYCEHPLLAEMARWEWCIAAVFDAADAQALTAQSLTAIAPEQWAQLRFKWHPSVTRLALRWNAPEIWQAFNEEREPPEPRASADSVPWLLWRRELSSYFRSLTPGEASALDAARSGWPFGELCELLCQEVGPAEAPARAAALLRGWVTSGLIIGTHS